MRCCKFNKISQNTVAIFLRHHFCRNRYFWFRCFLLVLQNGTHTHVTVDLAQMFSTRSQKLARTLTTTTKLYCISEVEAWESQKATMTPYFCESRHARPPAKRLYAKMWREQSIFYLAIRWRAISYFIIELFFSSILTFIVDLPIDFPALWVCVCVGL